MAFTLLDKLQEHVKTAGKHTAFFINEEYHSYAAFQERIVAIQDLLLTELDEDEDYVAVFTFNDLDSYAAIFALWYLGKAYVPLNPANPVERNLSVLEQTGVRTILSAHLPGENTSISKDVKLIDCSAIQASTKRRSPLHLSIDDEKDAYIIFTSGSTGKPKGVPISRGNLDAFVEDFLAEYELSRDDRFLQIYDLTFDASVHCYTLPLRVGASVYTVPGDQIKYLYAYKLMSNHKLTFVKMPPSTLAYLEPYFSRIHLDHLRYSLFGGEAFSTSLAEKWASCAPNAQIQNVYGPTEATINTHIYCWDKESSLEKSLNGIVSIGKCFGRNEALILGEDGKIAGPGEVGELLLGGSQLTAAYWKNEEQNENAFVELDFQGGKKRFYRTGDLARMDEEGDFMYVGRLDSQVQVQGYRVELGEIEKHAREGLGSENVAALAISNDMNVTEIYLFIENMESRIDFLAAYLEQNLPVYMLPKKIIHVPLFPKSAGGKINRTELKNILHHGID